MVRFGALPTELHLQEVPENGRIRTDDTHDVPAV